MHQKAPVYPFIISMSFTLDIIWLLLWLEHWCNILSIRLKISVYLQMWFKHITVKENSNVFLLLLTHGMPLIEYMMILLEDYWRAAYYLQTEHVNYRFLGKAKEKSCVWRVFTYINGIHQCAVLSPLIFTVYMDIYL